MTDDEQKELDLRGPGGFGVRAKGYRLMDIGMVIMAAGFAWGAWEMRAHAADSTSQTAAIVKSINDASDKMVEALKRVEEAQKQGTIEQKKTSQTMKEIACLNDPDTKNMRNARDFCKRQSER